MGRMGRTGAEVVIVVHGVGGDGEGSEVRWSDFGDCLMALVGSGYK